MPLTIETPAPEYLASYVDALERGWSPDNMRAETANDHLAAVSRDATSFLASLDDPEAKAGPITLPDGSQVARLPGFHRWLWDGDFCGTIGIRWWPGTSELPLHVLGHIGYAVVPWKRGRGYATQALALLLPLARAQGLSFVELTTDPDNIASQKVITANGGVLIGRFKKAEAYGGAESLKFRIEL
jgi:predicted acetyltransferase